MKIVPFDKINMSGQIVDNGDWKSLEGYLRFSETEMLRLRITFNKKTKEGVIRAFSFWEDFDNRFKQNRIDIEFNDKIKREFNDAKFVEA